MKNTLKLISVFIFLLLKNFSYSQINTEIRIQDPLKNGIAKGFQESNINEFIISVPQNAALQTLPEQRSQQQKKLVFGENISTNISLSNCKWVEAKEKRICKIKLYSKGAKSMNIRLSDFRLQDSATLYIYNEEGTVVMGPITSNQNNDAKIFLSSIFPGENLMIEVTENIASKQKTTFTISRVTYGIIDTYKGILSDGGASGSCEENVTCVSGAWHDEEKSAVRLLINGNTLCSACLVNNTAQDGTPYVLTANHCVVGEKNIENDISFVYFFKSRFCDSTKPTQNYKVYNRCYVRAHYYQSGFALLEMLNKPDTSEKYFYAGWSRDTMQASFAACLHFPQGDVMKYSESTLPVIDTAYGASGTKTKMYWIRWTGSGVTEDGSSGGALFNSSKQVIGELYDGPSFCGAKGNNKSDYFGGFFASWRGGGKTTNSLKNWLDPLQKNVRTLNGAYISSKNLIEKKDFIENENNKAEVVENKVSIFPNPAINTVTVRLSENLFKNEINFSISILTPDGKKIMNENISSSTFQINISSLKNGIYLLQINNKENFIVRKFMVEK